MESYPMKSIRSEMEDLSGKVVKKETCHAEKEKKRKQIYRRISFESGFQLEILINTAGAILWPPILSFDRWSCGAATGWSRPEIVKPLIIRITDTALDYIIDRPPPPPSPPPTPPSSPPLTLTTLPSPYPLTPFPSTILRDAAINSEPKEYSEKVIAFDR
ncbi:hypothetical protein V1478_014679 [Vespula squamosa]|uniref:Uncharacterized protein n=1 Tax=Vespula squamosa TaxID=30214 RepID=A0ABD2A3L4_VESSQ